jgi:hypothetical protein
VNYYILKGWKILLSCLQAYEKLWGKKSVLDTFPKCSASKEILQQTYI